MTEETTTTTRKGVPVWVQIIIWVFLVGLLGVVAMGLKRAQQTTAQPGQAIENFTLPFYDGYKYDNLDKISVKDLHGKVIVINFWASWCKPCEQEAADMQGAWEQYQSRGDVVFLGVDYVDTPADALIYLQKFGISYPNGEDLNVTLKRPVSDYFRIKGVPETYFVDRNGILKYVQVGPFSSVSQIQGILDPIIAQ